MNFRDGIFVSAIWKRWELYSETQQQAILKEFHRKFPNEYFNKNLLLQFLGACEEDMAANHHKSRNKGLKAERSTRESPKKTTTPPQPKPTGQKRKMQ